MASFEEKLREYARLLVEVGINLRPGQVLNLRSDVDCAPLARLCAEAAYELGAKDVVNEWRDDPMTRLRFLHADDAVFDQAYPWEQARYDHLTDLNAPYLVIIGSDPEAMAGVDPARITRANKTRYPIVKRYSDAQMDSRFQWSIGAYATPAWAAKVFPGLSREEAVAKLWDAIFDAVRVTGDGKAADRWQAHISEQKRVVDILNRYQFVSLHYENALGTDFTVGLPQGHYWAGGAEGCKSIPGLEFVANMPTEEVFTLPHRDQAEGRVYAALPLALHGNLIEHFYLDFKDGKIVDVHAEAGEEYLRQAIRIDEGASHLGEVALVPYHSPIRDTGILFYETLFDENAACHLAFGKAYPCLDGADGKSEDELLALGVNDSMTHVDFMVGTADLSITGRTADGREVPVFVNGDFAF